MLTGLDPDAIPFDGLLAPLPERVWVFLNLLRLFDLLEPRDGLNVILGR